VTVDTGGRPHLSVVIPAFNERTRLGDTLTAILAYLDGNRIHGEVVVVDDGSTDGTAELAAERLGRHRGRVVRNDENRGKGYSVRRGITEARGRWVLMSDADLSTPIEEHARLARIALDRDLDIVIASRGLPDSRIEVKQNAMRQRMGKTFNLIVRTMTGLRIRDTQCGFKLMDRNRVLPIVEKSVTDGFAFDVELLYVAKRFGLSIAEVPVVWRNSPDSKVGVLSAPPAMLLEIARVLWRFRRGCYNPEANAETIPPGS
jgi:dolichyl-phosphate beta-glucosyltransferase